MFRRTHARRPRLTARRCAPAAALGAVAAAAALLAAAPAGCRPRPPSPFGISQLMVPEGGGPPIRVEFGPADAGVVDKVLAALREAYPVATHWGPFRTEIRVRIYPSHEALEAELGRRHLDWLRAWATYDAVLLQSPLTWGGADHEKRLDELLKHELCHVAVYQLVATRESWEHVDLPLWFREGLASYTAKQEYRRGLPWEVGMKLLEEPMLDPLFAPEGLLLHNQNLVYAAAHWAFRELLDRHGEAGVRKILAGIARGLDFPRAFSAVAGETPRGFGERWRADVETLAKKEAAARKEAPAGTAGD